MGPLDLTHTLAPGRGCGDCYVCCEITTINDPALQKPEGQLCVNCHGGLCAVYEHRPKTCRDFHCLYRHLGDLPEAMRPDRCGVMFSTRRETNPESPFSRIYIGGYATGDTAAYETPEVQAAIRWLSEQTPLPIWLAFGKVKRLVSPDRELAEAIVQPSPHHSPDLKARAAAWAKRYDRWVYMYDTVAGVR
ncbi:MAG: hypothetical protein JSR45_03390 [Proteobacteria bacterium]|nr:hypothetical protein [Pseudomonadota bacterium]